MKLALLCIGGHKEPWLLEFAAEYEKKIKRFCDFEIIRLKPSKQERSSATVKLGIESAELLKAIRRDDVVVICDEKGESPGSKKWSDKLVRLFERGKPRVVIVIGGAFGMSEELRERADFLWSLSPMTLNHHVAQVVVLEQIYRAFAIWKNLPYHNE